jgi:hypothetical protein
MVGQQEVIWGLKAVGTTQFPDRPSLSRNRAMVPASGLTKQSDSSQVSLTRNRDALREQVPVDLQSVAEEWRVAAVRRLR